MIRTLSIRGFKSFPGDRDTVVHVSPENKPVRLFYGLNGAGKSAIGQVVDRLGRGEELAGCGIEPSDQAPYRYVIYNIPTTEFGVGIYVRITAFFVDERYVGAIVSEIEPSKFDQTVEGLTAKLEGRAGSQLRG